MLLNLDILFVNSLQVLEKRKNSDKTGSLKPVDLVNVVDFV